MRVIVFTYLKLQDLINQADEKRKDRGEDLIEDISNLSSLLEATYPKYYSYSPVYKELCNQEALNAKRIKESLFKHILEVLEIPQLELSHRYIKQPILC